jgi:hypothetical protein
MVFTKTWRKHALTAAVLLAAGAVPVASISAADAAPPARAHAGTGGTGASAAGWRQVSYRGYQFQVPRDWPVINLTARPTTCVRFDQHAVYLGQPGTRQTCPSGLIGATEALLVQPETRLATAPPPGGGAVEDPVAHRITVQAARITVTASYHSDRAEILTILASAGLPPPVIQNPAWMAARSSVSHPVSGDATNDTGKGFDACTAPSAQAMSAWLANSSYQAIGIYIGGSDRACAQPA